MANCLWICKRVSNLEFHVSVGLLRAEMHLLFKLLQRQISLLDLLSLTLPGFVQLASHLPLKQTQTAIRNGGKKRYYRKEQLLIDYFYIETYVRSKSLIHSQKKLTWEIHLADV